MAVQTDDKKLDGKGLSTLWGLIKNLFNSIVIPNKTSDLTNDSNFVSDSSYVHTDNNYTTNDKNKLDGIESGAEVNVQSDWNATSGDALIKNKPTIPAAVAVKGDAETTYRTGNVNITPANIGVYTKTQIDALTRHTRLTDFDLNVLKQAVADQNLEKYGLKVGDQKTINGRTYVIAGLNPMKGTHNYTCTSNHVGLIVIPHTTQKWNASGNTYTGADSRGAGYKNSDLHYYLKNTLLPLVETDLGAANLLAHYKLLSNAVNQNGINRYGEATGCSSNWTWEADCKICALSEVQVYGSIVWSSSGFDTGEACQQLEVFRRYNKNEIFEGEYPWLRDVVSASRAAVAYYQGYADRNTASRSYYVAALILFH